MYLRHQRALEFRGFRPPTGPNDARNADRLFGAFGLDIVLDGIAARLPERS